MYYSIIRSKIEKGNVLSLISQIEKLKCFKKIFEGDTYIINKLNKSDYYINLINDSITELSKLNLNIDYDLFEYYSECYPTSEKELKTKSLNYIIDNLDSVTYMYEEGSDQKSFVEELQNNIYESIEYLVELLALILDYSDLDKRIIINNEE